MSPVGSRRRFASHSRFARVDLQSSLCVEGLFVVVCSLSSLRLQSVRKTVFFLHPDLDNIQRKTRVFTWWRLGVLQVDIFTLPLGSV